MGSKIIHTCDCNGCPSEAPASGPDYLLPSGWAKVITKDTSTAYSYTVCELCLAEKIESLFSDFIRREEINAR